MRYILAHDLGTSGNKATLYAEDGTRLGNATVGYPTHFFNGNWAEQEPEDWWRAVCDSTKRLLAESHVDPAAIAVVSLSGQMMGCTPVDAEGRALRPSLLYCDQRATKQAAALLAAISMPEFYAICGHRANESYSLAKLMWLRDNEPDVFAKTRKTLCAKDYINARLTGAMKTEYSDASGMNAFDLNTFQWSKKVLAAANIDEALLPEAVPSTAIVGEVTSRAAAECGLKPGTPVAAGGGDGCTAGVGSGCVRPGTAYNCFGSSSWIAVTTRKPLVEREMRTMNWAHCVPGFLQPTGTMQTACSSFRWLADQLCGPEQIAAAASGKNVFAEIDRVAATVPPGAHGVLFLPYMLGERTPWWDSAARGAFIGLNLESKREDMLRAVLEGVTMNLAIIADIFREHVAMDKLTSIGGGSESAVCCQLLADCCAAEVDTLTEKSAACSLGAAVVGGVACGIFKDFNVVDSLLKVDHRYLPQKSNTALYAKRRKLLEASYLGLKNVYAGLAKGE